ncbi:MAG: methyltransferase, partial [Chloroflexota bacterium]
MKPQTGKQGANMTPQSDAHEPSKVPSIADTSQTLSNMITGFRLSQMIYVATKLGIPDLLKNGALTADALAQATGTHAPSLYRVLRALASVGIFAEDEQGRFALTPLAQQLQAEVPGSQRAKVLVFGEPSRWRSWGEMLYSVTTGEPAFPHLYGMDSWEYVGRDPELNATFNDYMTANTTPQTAAIVESYDFSGIGTLVDVGGGHGILISALLQANPKLHGILCDAPHVVTGAGPILEAAGVIDRCEIVPCDFFSSVPAGGDIYLLKFIIHDWDDEHALAILKTCRRAMPEDSRLLLIENVIPPGNDPHPGKMTDLHMLVV